MMISQLASFDHLLLPPPASSTVAATVTQANDCAGGDGAAEAPIAVMGEKQCRKRKRSLASNDDNNSGNNDGTACASSSASSSASAQGDATSPKLAGVEQQLVASSPTLFLQQALRHNLVDGGGSAPAQAQAGDEQHGAGMAMDFFEAHKAFQKLSNQLAVGFSAADSSPSPAAMAPPHQQQTTAMMNHPFMHQLATLSPFLMALQHQSQQFVQAQQHHQQFDPASLFAIPPPIHNASENLLHHFASSPLGYAKGGEEDEEEEEDGRRSNNSVVENAAGEPEDLSLKHGSASDGNNNSSNGNGQQHRNGGTTPNWSYEEQFKQLYELSPTDLNRKEWLDDWLEYMRRIGKPVTRIPIMAKSVLDLYELYRLVVQHGGLVEVITKKMWREIAKGLNLPTSITSAAFTLRTQYEKYLFDYECYQHKFSTPDELNVAIESNKRDGRRNAPPATSAGVKSNSARATPSGSHHHHNNNQQHNHHSNSHHHHHHFSGGRHSSSNSADSQRERHVQQQQQQQIRWLEQMAASFGGTAPPAPPMVAAAFFGKQLLQFGTADAMPTARAPEDNLVNGSRAPSAAQPTTAHFAAGPMPHPYGHQNGEGQQQFESIFPKIELAAGRTSTSPQALFSSQRQNASAEPRRCVDTAASSPATSSYHYCPSSEHRQQQQSPKAPSTQKRRKPSSETLAPATACRPAPSPKNSVADNGTSVAPLGPFDHLLTTALRCNIKMQNNGGETKSAVDNSSAVGTLPQATTTTSATADASASPMVMSMEINGVLYRGVLFPMPAAEREMPAENGTT